MPANLNIVIFGLSLSSSWGNGHATTYRHLLEGLCSRGHRVLFLERDKPWYAANRDLPNPPHGEFHLYDSIDEAFDRFGREVQQADVVIVGSYVPEGTEVGLRVTREAQGVTAFYDIDTPVTLDRLEEQDCEYLSRELIPQYDLYLSFTGGPTLRLLEQRYGSPCARALYCSVDPEYYRPESREQRYDLGYMGTYSPDRQRGLEQLLIHPARSWPQGRFIVAGPQFPDTVAWPDNVERREHLPPAEHCHFYNQQRFTLNLTRSAMRRMGYSPSIRLFEAAACGTAIISDTWAGLDELFQLGSEILVASSAREALEHLQKIDDEDRREIGRRARQRVLARHTGRHRAIELEQYVADAAAANKTRQRRRAAAVAR